MLKLLLSESEEAKSTIVLLNGKPLKSYIKACQETKDTGWVEVVDLKKMLEQVSYEENPQIQAESFTYDSELTEDLLEQSLPTKVLTGKIEFITVKT